MTSTTLTGLTPNTLYQWQVRPICNGVPAGPYSVSNTITIPPSPIRMSSSVLNDQFTVYPNPATDLVNIRFESTENSKIKIQLIDLTGRILNSREFTAVNGENLFSLPLTGLSKGIYTIIVENGDVKRQSRISVD